MKLLPETTLREVRGRHLLMIYRPGASGVMALEVNESFAFLWEHLAGKDFTPEDVAVLLQTHYQMPLEQARAETEKILRLWREEQLLTES